MVAAFLSFVKGSFLKRSFSTRSPSYYYPIQPGNDLSVAS